MGRDQWWGNKTYSQHGEDLFFANAFHLMGIQNPSYLDIGAHHPEVISNTALLYSFGSRGINVEANPNLIENFHNKRPEDINLNCGVGPEQAVLPFYMIDKESGRNTFSKKEADSFVSKHKEFSIAEVIPIPVFTIDDIVKRHARGFYPDLLCTDIEGLDYDVISSANMDNSSPKMICAEVRKYEEQMFKDTLRPLFVAACRFGENLIFIREDMYKKVFP